MSKRHPGKQFMLGAMIGSTLGAVSAMMFTSKKGHQIQKNAMHKLHEFEEFIKGAFNKNTRHAKHFVRRKKAHVQQLASRGKRKVMNTMKHLNRVTKRRKSKAR